MARRTWLLLMAFVIVAIAWSASGEQPAPRVTSVAELAVSATVVCQRAVKARLLAPATARFGYVPIGPDLGANAAGEWVVRGPVDASNAFGALIRSHYACTLRHVAADSFALLAVRVQ